jgi:hypothetical protein
LATSAITSSLLSQIAGSPSAANQFVTDLNQLATDLKSGNLSAAQQDYVTLSQDAQNGVTSSSATTSDSGITASLLSDVASSSTGLTIFTNELGILGNDLQNGDLTSAQNDMLTLEGAASTAAPQASATSSATTNQAQTEELVRAAVQAIAAGDPSAASSALSQLASVSSSSQGASYIQALSANLGGSSSGSSSSSSITQLLDSLNSSASSSSSPLLSLLA